MFEEIKRHITEAEDSRKLSSVLIYQDNIEEVSEDIDSSILQIRSLMESNNIQAMLDDKTINEDNFDRARDGYELVYKKIFDIKNDLDATKDMLADLVANLSGTESEGAEVAQEVRSESFDIISDYLYVKEGMVHLTELFGSKKLSEPIMSVINQILNLSIPHIKELLKKIDFTKQYKDEDIDKLIIALKQEIVDVEKSAPKPRSIEDVMLGHNIKKAIASGKRPVPVYTGV